MTQSQSEIIIEKSNEDFKSLKNDSQELLGIPLMHESLNLQISKLEKNEKLFIFDIDNTLYKQANGMHENIVELITAFACTIIADKDEAIQKVSEYYTTYGVTIKGFLAEHRDKTDLNVWEAMYDHQLKIEEFVLPDLALRKMLILMKQRGVRLFALTNSSYNVGSRMLRSLGVLDIFEAMFHCAYLRNCDFMCKPQQQVYDFIEELLGVTESRQVYVFEDRDINLTIPIKKNWNAHLITVDNHIKKVLSSLMD